MDWLQVIITIVGLLIGNGAIIIPLFLWNRSESNSDRRDMINIIRSIEQEMKDFHARLCVIEERRK